jgi:hypothetical protein
VLQDNLDQRTVFDLITSHGRIDMLLHYAAVVGDFERIVAHWVQEEEWAKALDTLSRQVKEWPACRSCYFHLADKSTTTHQDDVALYYRYAPVLMKKSPKETVDTLMRRTSLDVRRLIPALLPPRPVSVFVSEQIIRYLQFAILELHVSDAAVHNALLNFYATSMDPDETALLHFLSSSPDDPQTGRPLYDLDYALRVCKANKRLRACIHIYSKMGLYESSVDLALANGDIELAKVNADKPVDNDLLRKKLWLKIARHVVHDKQDIKTCVRAATWFRHSLEH